MLEQPRTVVERTLKEFENDNEFNRWNLTLAKDMARHWRDVFLTLPEQLKHYIDDQERLIVLAVKVNWGEKSVVEFDRENKKIKCIHESGMNLWIT